MQLQVAFGVSCISIHVPREGDDSAGRCVGAPVALFLSTSPARGTTTAAGLCTNPTTISIHVPREGDDAQTGAEYNPPLYFYPRPPRGGRRAHKMPANRHNNFYPRPPRGGRHRTMYRLYMADAFLSTSPARGTTTLTTPGFARSPISIHVPREGDDGRMLIRLLRTITFLSTSPARGTTVFLFAASSTVSNFYPRPPRGGRPVAGQPGEVREVHFYPRPPRGGRHNHLFHSFSLLLYFYPRPPRGGRRLSASGSPFGNRISIHVPREGDDRDVQASVGVAALFLSTSPARGTTHGGLAHVHRNLFLSTSPARGTTFAAARR